MFLSPNQLDLIERAYEKPVDLLQANVLTVAALSARGLAQVQYARSMWQVSKVVLTSVGKKIGAEIDTYRSLPTFKTILSEVSPRKRALKRHAQHVLQ